MRRVDLHQMKIVKLRGKVFAFSSYSRTDRNKPLRRLKANKATKIK